MLLVDNLRMMLLQAVRQSKSIARCVLAWFVLSMAVAVAAPIANPQASALVCSASGSVKLVSGGGDTSVPVAGHSLDCVLCLVLGAPPVAMVQWSSLPRAPSAQVPARLQSPVPFRSDSKLAARGPPALI